MGQWYFPSDDVVRGGKLYKRGWKLELVTKKSVTAGVTSNVSWHDDGLLFDTDEFWDMASSALSVTITVAGWYIIGYGVDWAGNSIGIRNSEIKRWEEIAQVNSYPLGTYGMPASGSSLQSNSTLIHLDVGDQISLQVKHTSTTDPLNVDGKPGTNLYGILLWLD